MCAGKKLQVLFLLQATLSLVFFKEAGALLCINEPSYPPPPNLSRDIPTSKKPHILKKNVAQGNGVNLDVSKEANTNMEKTNPLLKQHTKGLSPWRKTSFLKIA